MVVVCRWALFLVQAPCWYCQVVPAVPARIPRPAEKPFLSRIGPRDLFDCTDFDFATSSVACRIQRSGLTLLADTAIILRIIRDKYTSLYLARRPPFAALICFLPA